MSIYQTRAKRPINDFATPPSTRGGPVAPVRPMPSAQTLAQDWNRVRRTKPVNYMLPKSLDWLATLPQEVRPRALERQYPRIANLIALQWNNAAACRAYFDDLLTDHRGTRKGFPADVYRDLTVLRNYHYNQQLTLQE